MMAGTLLELRSPSRTGLGGGPTLPVPNPLPSSLPWCWAQGEDSHTAAISLASGNIPHTGEEWSTSKSTRVCLRSEQAFQATAPQASPCRAQASGVGRSAAYSLVCTRAAPQGTLPHLVLGRPCADGLCGVSPQSGHG